MATTPGAGGSRFPGFDVTAQAQSWDEQTRAVVWRRLDPAPTDPFFTADERETAGALIDRLLAQDQEPRVPVLGLIEERLAAGAGDGFRYRDMPEDPEAWRCSLAALDTVALRRYGRRFPDLDDEAQLALLDEVQQEKGQWQGLPAPRTFSLWMRYACTAFYSHPWAWNEIGFGGPAYPRGYKNLGFDRLEPWEVRERDAPDPGPWAQRAERIRQNHSAAVRRGRQP